MRFDFKKIFSLRTIAVVLAALLVLSAFNTYMIFESTRSSMTSSPVNYDYVVSQNGNGYRLKNMLTGYVADEPSSASSSINTALANGKSVYLNAGTYVLTEDIVLANKANGKITSDGATVVGNGHKIVVYGDDYTLSRNNVISGLTLINATLRVENSLGTTISNMLFENTSIGIEFANTKSWTEYSKVEDSQFINATQGIVFRTPEGNGTGSYASSIIQRVSFNIRDYSVGIYVEPLAEFSDSQLQDVRFWMGENGNSHQTGLLVDGSMYKTLLLGVVFESFTLDPDLIFGVELGKTCDPAPILDGGVSFLGNWTAKIQNPHAIWISGVGSVFKRQDEPVEVGLNNQYGVNQSIQVRPLTIFSFKPKITVQGSFSQNETLTVRIRIQYIDNSVSDAVVYSFTSSGSVWLSDDDMMQLFSSQSLIWDIVFDAKASSSSTDAQITVSGYGTAG